MPFGHDAALDERLSLPHKDPASQDLHESCCGESWYVPIGQPVCTDEYFLRLNIKHINLFLLRTHLTSRNFVYKSSAFPTKKTDFASINKHSKSFYWAQSDVCI